MHTIGRSAFQCSGLTSFKAPERLRLIEQEAFADCSDLKNVTLNRGIKSIGPINVHVQDANLKGVFENSGIQTIDIPSTVKMI